MQIRKYNQEDFHILKKWFDQWGWQACEPECIPENGYFVLLDDKEVAFSCFLATDCAVAIMGVTISDKQAKDKSKAIDYLTQNILQKAKELGYKYIHYYTDTKAMVKRMEKQGMKITDNGTAYVLIGSLGGDRIKFFEEQN